MIYSNRQGMTLVEMIIYTALVSLLLANTIDYLYAIHIRNIKLSDDIYHAQNQ